MNIIECKNNVIVSYNETKETDFIRFELWLNFGSKDDGSGQDGIAHFIEHLLTSLDNGNIDLYSFYSSYAYTNKERIRLYFDAHKSNAIKVLENMLRNLVDFNVPDMTFQYQQQKVSVEIKRTRFGPVTAGLQEIETTLLSGTGYDRLPIGKVDDILNLTYSQVKSHLEKCIKQYGMQISITGAVSNITELVNIIENTVYPVGVNTPIQRYDTALFNSTEMVGSVFPDGHILMLNKYDESLDTTTNISCAKLMEAYLRHNLMHLPIEIIGYDYRHYQVLLLYITNRDGNANEMAQTVKKLFATEIAEMDFDLYRSYVYHDYLQKSQNFIEFGLFNSEQLFWGTKVCLHNLTEMLKKFELDVFRNYLAKRETIGNYVHVTLKNS